MTGWELGEYRWDSYYKAAAFQFKSNAPYSAPFSFQVLLGTGQVVEGQQVISSLSSSDSGTVSFTVSNAFTYSEDEQDSDKPKVVAVVIIVIIGVFCVFGIWCFVCYRRRHYKNGVKVEDDEVIIDEMEQEADGTKQCTKREDVEQQILINVQVRETKQ